MQYASHQTSPDATGFAIAIVWTVVGERLSRPTDFSDQSRCGLLELILPLYVSVRLTRQNLDYSISGLKKE